MTEQRIAELVAYLEENKGDRRFYQLLEAKPKSEQYENDYVYKDELENWELNIQLLANKVGDQI